MRQHQPLPPKPFHWVPLGGTPERRKPYGHDSWSGDYTGVLECTLTLLTPLHVGSGLFRLAGGQVLKEAVRQGERLIIPGSSLKGVFRSIAEAISLSCVSKTEQRVQINYHECRDVNNFCVCCRLFGGLGYLGRVRFSDTFPTDQGPDIHNIPTLRLPKQPEEGRKFYKHGQPAKGNEPFEVCPSGTQFVFSVDVESLTKAEMCLLLTAMGIIGGIVPKVGGGKPRCLGSVRVDLQQARFWTPQNASLAYERIITTLSASQLCQQVEKSNSLIKHKALERLKNVLKYPGNTECPTGLY